MLDKLADMLEYGPIVAVSEELGLIVTRNGAYYNIFNDRGECLDCRAVDEDMYQITAAKLWDEGKTFFDD